MTNIAIVTNKGEINLNLFDNDAPMTVASFLFLAKQGFYDGIVFHRVIANFMIQVGCPLGQGTGGPKNKGINSFPFQGKQINYPFKDEFQSGREFNSPGILAMANSGKNTNGSQMFITHIPTPHLNNKHTIFGKVVSQDDQRIVNSIAQGDKISEIKIL
ncbi:MAG: putative peptidyl-prolyl cis-trans isomerase [Candidatus Lokiarchaeum sp. GC14_75]|nr:MAG: putative peptidyl-prolyl cis-trans isomerase [Candidatus Lokiarchaeum sp. GC14_75]